MTRSRSDNCIYILLAAILTGAIATFVLPFFLPEVDTLWTTILATIIGMIFASLLLWIQDNSKKRKYRGQV